MTSAALRYDPAGNISSYGSRTFSSTHNFTTSTTGAYSPDSSGLGRVRSALTMGASYFMNLQYMPNGQLSTVNKISNSTGSIIETDTYYYDGLGRRLAKTIVPVSGTPTTVTYSHLGAEDRVVTAKLVRGTTTNEVLYGDGQGIDEHLFELSSSTGVKAYQTDHLGSVLNGVAIGGKSTYVVRC